ncbi:Protein of unknown function (DUF4235) [Prauserella aidingensis]|uniref:DUF4235 domain-containing protein n=1 Tax=Prauserella aidingensis TaxID=387890 RepID=UPI0020A4C9C1|nr:DUF4235 domain-containing protein [Prauserella aidingensis]MCP2252743.1 Protein of unknown function (DUF4235) [Prauserella aidingensis]
MKLLYKALTIPVGAAGGMLATTLFGKVWKRVSGQDTTPQAADRRYPAWQVVLAAALQGAVFGAVKAAVDRAGASGYERASGEWPGDE